MPDRGQLALADIAAGPLAETPAWECPNARWLQITFEAARDAVLALMPCEVTRTVPCYARVFVADAPETPAGPLTIAALLAGGRFQLQPHNLLVDALAQGPIDRIQSAFGTAIHPGRITLTRDASSIAASIERDGLSVATVALPAIRAIDAGMLRWDPWLGVARGASDTQLFEFAVTPRLTAAFLSRGASFTAGSGLARDDPWWRLRSLLTISACYAEGTLVLGERVFAQASA